MSTDAALASLLQFIQDGDDHDELVDNQMIADALAWSLDDVAACLQEAKDRSLIWGSRSGQLPAPWYTELEVTVQGRRFLQASVEPEAQAGGRIVTP